MGKLVNELNYIEKLVLVLIEGGSEGVKACIELQEIESIEKIKSMYYDNYNETTLFDLLEEEFNKMIWLNYETETENKNKIGRC